MKEDNYSILPKMNFIEFNSFLSNIPENQANFEGVFTLNYSFFWIDDLVDVDIKISIHQKRNIYFECKIPFYNKWVEIFWADSKERLFEMIYMEGLGKISKIFKEYNVLYQIHHNIFSSVNEKEKKHNISLFGKGNNINKLLEVWQYNKSNSEVISRIGKDNTIISEMFVKYFLLIGGELIEDEFLENLVPKENHTKEYDSGFIPSHKKIYSETAFKDLEQTKNIRENYNAISHYIFLAQNKLRDIHYDDQFVYKQSLKKE